MTQNMSKTMKDSETTKNTTATTKKKKKNNNCIKEEEDHKKLVALCFWQEVRFQSLLRPWPLLLIPVVLCPVPRFQSRVALCV